VRPGEKPPVLPAIAHEHTAAGAAAVAVFYIHALDWGYATMDSTLAKSVFAKSCTDCLRFVTNFFGKQVALGHHYAGSRLYISATRPIPNDKHYRADVVVDITVNQLPGRLLTTAGDLVRVEPAVPNVVFRTWLDWLDGRWTISEWKREIVK
jgi:hypothetical protein